MGPRESIPQMAIATAIVITTVSLATQTDGFCASRRTLPPGLNRDSNAFGPKNISPSSSFLSALVYGADGSVVRDDVFDNNDEKAKEGKASPSNDDVVLESLKSSVNNPLVWKKLACAFAPPPHNHLTLEMTRDAIPVGVSDTSINIAVSVPASAEAGSNQLIRVLVTVTFPQAFAIPSEADPSDKVSSIVQQIGILEGLAGDRLKQRSPSASRDDPNYYEKQVIEQRRKETLEEEPLDGALPRWWTAIAPPFSSLELRDEAKLLKKLLNEDEFEDELRALFVQHHGEGSTNGVILRAVVASIGSSGIFLRARVASSETIASVTIPYNNPLREVNTIEELREGVLLLVESVDPMPMPQVTTVSKEIDGSLDTTTPFNEQVMEFVTKLESDTKSSPLPDTDPKDAETDATMYTGVSDESDNVVAPEAIAKADEEVSLGKTQQPRPPEEEAKLAAKYAAIEDLGERAFAILCDLGMV